MTATLKALRAIRRPTMSATAAASTMAQKPTRTADFLSMVTERRSNYTLSPASTIPDAEIQRILETTLDMAPSSFGSYTTRMVLLVRDEHFKFWDMTASTVHAVTPAEKWTSHTKPRLDGFRNAYGTVLFFEDPTNMRILQEKFPFVKDALPTFGRETNAMHQYIVWTALTTAGLGVNLQHYSPLIDAKVQEMYHVPTDWTLTSQLVFGTPTQPSNPKSITMAAPMNERLFVYGTKDGQRTTTEERGEEEGIALVRTHSRPVVVAA